MYCPTCGSEERQISQFCRACGTDLRAVRQSLEVPDSVTASAISAREQISKAFADKIRETESIEDLKKVAEDVLPEIEKFLESPEERRLRRIQAGVIVTLVGIGAWVAAAVGSSQEAGLIVFLIPALITFFVGVAILINGLLFSRPRKRLRDVDENLRKRFKDVALPEPSFTSVNTAERRQSSVTEHTTKHLGD